MCQQPNYGGAVSLVDATCDKSSCSNSLSAGLEIASKPGSCSDYSIAPLLLIDNRTCTIEQIESVVHARLKRNLLSVRGEAGHRAETGEMQRQERGRKLYGADKEGQKMLGKCMEKRGDRGTA